MNLLPVLPAVIVNGLVWGGVYATIALGLNLIYGVMNILNIAHGELVMVGAFFAFWLFTLWGVNPFLSAVLILPLMFGFGVVLQSAVVDPISRVSRSVETLESGSLVAFFGVLLILQNGALSLWATDYRTVPYLAQPVQIGGATVTVSRLLILGIAVIVPFLVHFFLSRTLLGKAIRAVSQDREVGLLLGVNARAIGLLTFGIGAALAGMAGALVSMIYLFTPVVGLIFTVKGFTVMVLGGLGKPLGALGAGLSIGVAEAVISFFVGEGYRDVIGYVLLVAFVLFVYFVPGVRWRREIAA